MENELAIPSPASPSPLSPEQKETAELLLTLLGKAISDRYVDFCALSAGTMKLRVSRPIAAHALRELECILRSILATQTDAEAGISARDLQRRDDALSCLAKLGYNQNFLDEARKALTPRVSHRAQINATLARLDIPVDGDVGRLWRQIADINSKAHQRSFHKSLTADDEFRRDWADPFHTVIREVALALKRRYATLLFRCVEIAKMDPKKGVKAFQNEVPGAFQLQWHFYKTLESEAWLPVLARNGLLKEPMALNEDEQAGIRFRQWPVSRYLLRMASSSENATRSLVVSTIRSLKGTKHPDVQAAIIEIFEQLPIVEASEVTDVVVDLLATETGIAPYRVPSSIKRLAEGGESKSALLVFEELFRVFERNGTLASRFENSMFAHFMDEVVASLASAAPVQTIPVLCRMLLETSIIDGRFGESDHTTYYASRIGDSTTSVFEIPGAIVSAIVKCGQAAISADISVTPSIVADLLDLKANIFQRLALHFLAMSPSSAPELADTLLTDPRLIDASWCRDEYGELAVAAFENLRHESQRAILDYVEAVPRTYEEGWKERFQQHMGRTPTEAEHREYRSTTTRDIYWTWSNVLPATHKAAFDAAVEEFGGRDDWKGRLFQPRPSPLTAKEMQEQPVEETISFLNSVPLQDASGYEGLPQELAGELRTAVSISPMFFSIEAEKFSSLNPFFLKHLFEGLHNSAINSGLKNWDQIITLLEKLAASTNGFGDISAGTIYKQQRVEMCEAAAELLSGAFRVADSPLEPALEQRIQNLVIWLHSMLNDSRAAKSNGGSEYFNARMTKRGLGVELCVSFILWCSRNDGRRATTLARGTLGRLKDIQCILDAELADRSPRGRIPRVIIGRHLTWFFYFAEDWLRGAIADLFPESVSYLRDAAWGAHLEADRGPIRELFDELSPCYNREVSRLAQVKNSEQQRNRQHRLAEYLLVLRVWGDSEESLLRSFYASASPEARRHAMWFLAQALTSTDENGAVAMRARELWASRLQEALTSKQPDHYREELGVIGTWFAMGVDVDWLLPQLRALLQGGFSPNSTYNITDKLASKADLDIDFAVAVLRDLVSSQRKGSSDIVGSIGDIKTIILKARTSSSETTAKNIDEIISLLAYTGDADLLDLHSSQV